MKIQITGEQPFQVLGTTFSIGPSESGYDLMFSADGRSYSKLFTVGANVNRQVTQVAAGSYYLLSGNTDTVTVNWMGDCWGGSGSGGGGGYVLPVASQNTLGGIKVGSGLTIDSNGILSANGGGGSEAFKVTVSSHHVDEWTSDDYSALTEMIEYLSGRTDMVEAYIDAVSMDGSLLSGGERFTLTYLERESAVFSFPDYPSNLLYSIYLNFEDVESSESWYTTIPEEGEGPRVILLNNLSQSELVDLYDELTGMYDYQNSAFTTAFTASDYAFYLDLTDSTKQNTIGVYDRNYEGWFPMQLNYVNPSDYDGGAIYFTGVEGRQDGNGYLYNIRFVVTNQGLTEPGCWIIEAPQPDYQYNIQITSGGTFENPDELGIFSAENYNYKVMFVWREGNDQPGWGQGHLANVWRKLDQSDNLVYYWTVDSVPIDGVLYKGAWHATENDWWNYTTDSWTTV